MFQNVFTVFHDSDIIILLLSECGNRISTDFFQSQFHDHAYRILLEREDLFRDSTIRLFNIFTNNIVEL